MSGRYLLGIDIGTTGAKAVIVNLAGQLISKGYDEYPISIPRMNWAEQDPNTWWKAAIKSIKEAVKKANISQFDIAGIGLSSQTNSPTFLDKNGKPLRPSILWMDGRAEPQAVWVREKIGEETIHRMTGVKIAPFYSVYKILWVKNEQPEIYKKCKVILQPKDYIGFKLTGECVLDVALASSSGFTDIKQRSYANELLDELGLSLEKLPNLVSPSDIIGEVTKEAAEATELAEGTPVIAGSGDVMTNAIGSGVIEKGQAYNKIATAADLAVCVDHPVFDRKFRFVSYVHALPEKWILMGGSGEAVCYRWFRDKFCQLETVIAKQLSNDPYEIMDKEAERVPPGSHNLVFLPYLTGVRSPIWDSNARGVFFGISLNHGKEHFIRSIMEGVAYSIRHRIDIIEKELNIPINEVRVVGGGARSAIWRRIMVDVYGKQIIFPKGEELECLGAVILASLGIKLYKNANEACSKLIAIADPIKPNEENHEKYEKLFQIYVSLYEKLKDIFTIVNNIY